MIRPLLKTAYRLAPRSLKSAYYLTFGRRRPWSGGYISHKFNYVKRTLRDKPLMKSFETGAELPSRYGIGLDERIVEYPWALAKITSGKGALLDAGSAMNYEEILEFDAIAAKKITIANLNPEENCFWKRGVSYLYDDLRRLPLRSEIFDYVTCISTLEHIGLDNTSYTRRAEDREANSQDFEKALRELKRVLVPGGKLLLTVPFGEYENFGWFQQFDSGMIRRIREVFAPSSEQVRYYAYSKDGWNISDEDRAGRALYFPVFKTKYFDKKSSKGFDEDMAAGARAVACLELFK